MSVISKFNSLCNALTWARGHGRMLLVILILLLLASIAYWGLDWFANLFGTF
ncbi:MAG: hypothetical protein PHW13_12630 [Methylococcales bacterium]|nr:hypothetical protein [Methylococcales bacterium]